VAALVGVAWAAAAVAQDTPATPQPADWQTDLDQVLQQIQVTQERRDELQQEIDDLDQDRATLNQQLIETNQRVQELEGQLDATEQRMADLVDQEDAVRAQLADRRDVLAEVLAALQRMGQAPPPAIIVEPEDALAAVRRAILLGAVVPEIRGEAEALAADIEQLVALRQEQEDERQRIIDAATEMADEQERLELLIAERQQALDQTAESLQAEQDRLGTLAAMADTLEELIADFEAGDGAPENVAAAPAAPVEPGAPDFLGDADRITPAIPFASAQGQLPRPANGDLVTGFGVDDGLGGITRGESIETRPAARVSSPADGWIEFAGPYRSYGNLLIIDAGDGYRIVLAGMERIDVQRGQFVLAGEPVGAMRSAQVAAAGEVALGTVRPVLYVEFRKDGESIDPDPWWADPY
jgi:septal ring factor EnvC (AmiA/AmiB activator)